MSKLVTIYGGSGFVGRYIARRMAKEGWRVRVAVRRPNEAMFVRPYGAVGQVEPMLCNVRDDASVRQVMEGADAVVNCVGILSEVGKNTFDSVQADGAERIARIASETGVAHMVQLSALGADVTSPSEYARTKAEGEEAVLKHMPNAMILRPSIIFGPEDQFFNRFASMTKMSPFLPLVGGKVEFQPVYVDDVAKAAVAGIKGAATGVFELGGPETASFKDLMTQMLEIIRRRRIIINLPAFAARLTAFGFDMMQTLSLGLITNKMLTRDQVRNLTSGADNVVSQEAKSFADLGIEPVAMDAILSDYLWRFRPSGQYDAIKESARNLRSEV